MYFSNFWKNSKITIKSQYNEKFIQNIRNRFSSSIRHLCVFTRSNINLFLNNSNTLIMKTTIWQIIGTTVMIPATVTAETELSYIAKSDHEFATEFCYPKQYEGITWFWTEEEAKAESKFRKSPEFRMQELKKELEKLETETSQV